MPKLSRAHKIVERWNGRGHGVERIWISGAGAEDADCPSLTAQWMQDQVLRVVAGEDIDLDDWEELEL